MNVKTNTNIMKMVWNRYGKCHICKHNMNMNISIVWTWCVHNCHTSLHICFTCISHLSWDLVFPSMRTPLLLMKVVGLAQTHVGNIKCVGRAVWKWLGWPKRTLRILTGLVLKTNTPQNAWGLKTKCVCHTRVLGDSLNRRCVSATVRNSFYSSIVRKDAVGK